MAYLPQSQLLASQGIAEAYLQTSAALLSAAVAGSQAAGARPHPNAEGSSALLSHNRLLITIGFAASM